MLSTRFFATTAKGIEPILVDELVALGGQDVQPTIGGVHFTGTLETLYRANLWLRTANRVLMPLAEFPCPTPEALYEGARLVRWQDWLSLTQTFAVDGTCRDSQITHSHYAALKIKDAIVDGLRELTGQRPNVELRQPDLRINAHIASDHCVLSLDASGERLNVRGYRRQAQEAPLRETLAAAIVALVDWDSEGVFIDPMCGSGTILIEAAMRAMKMAPGLLRPQGAFGFQRWPTYDERLWQRLIDEAKDSIGEHISGRLLGYDISREAVSMAQHNAQLAGINRRFHVERGDILNLRPKGKRGVVVCNLPYGERTGDVEALKLLYRGVGDVLKQRFTGYTAYLFTGNLALAKCVGLRTSRRYTLYNGQIECRLLKYELF